MESDDDGDVSESKAHTEDVSSLSSETEKINDPEILPADANEYVNVEVKSQISSISQASSDFESNFVTIDKNEIPSNEKHVHMINMTSDVEDLTTFYGHLPSIFENNTLSIMENSYNINMTDVTTEKSYQPIFGSFILADSDPLSKAAFADSSSTIQLGTANEQLQMNKNVASNQNNLLDPSQIEIMSSQYSVPIEDIDEDDFDGIPLRHSSLMTRKESSNNDNLTTNHNKYNQTIDTSSNSHNIIDIDEDDTFLNGFTNEQHNNVELVPSLFKDIPDIDDPNQYEDDNNNDQIPYDQTDMFDHSDSIRSSSPDSLLSSSHLQDDDDDDRDIDDNNNHDDDDNDDDEVAQWNDDLLLDKTVLKINPQANFSAILQPTNPFEQVDFIDSSRSTSRCSDVSSHLSNGYADQARTFMSDDGLTASSDSDEDDNNDEKQDFDNDEQFDQNKDEDLCLQVNLDDHRSLTSSNMTTSSTRSSSPSIHDQTPIVDIDEDAEQTQTLQIAPIAALDDEDHDELTLSASNQPILPSILMNMKYFRDLNNEKRKTDIAHDIIHMRHLFNENDHDDEFLAIMHNPQMFEEILFAKNNSNKNNDYSDDEKTSDLFKQENSVTTTFRPSSQSSIANEIKKELLEHHEYKQNLLSFPDSNNEQHPNIFSSPFSTRKTPNNSSPIAVSHLANNDVEEKNVAAFENAVNTVDILNIKQEKERLSTLSLGTSENGIHYNKIMNADTESDDDSELLNTLSQLHTVIHSNRSYQENNEIKCQLFDYTPDINQEKNLSDLSIENIATSEGEIALCYENKYHNNHTNPSTTSFIDTTKKSPDEHRKEDEKKSVISHKNHDADGGRSCDDVNKKEKYERKEEKKPTTLTSTTSRTSFNDDSHLTVVFIDPDTSSILPNALFLPLNKPNETTSVSNQLIADDLQILNTRLNMSDLPNNESNQQTTSDLFDPFAPIETKTITTTKTDMIDDLLFDSNDSDMKTFDAKSNVLPSNSASIPHLANYDFDDLWNQSISHIESSNNNDMNSNNTVDPNTFSWDTFFNNDNQQSKNPFNNTTNITWESLFNEEPKVEEKSDLKEFLDWIIDHLNDTQDIETKPESAYTSTQNLESIIPEIEINTLPFEPIPSPPLHVDHTVANPMINAIHHELFPIDELEPTYSLDKPQSMIIYEEDENEDDDEKKTLLPSRFDDQAKPIIEKFVSNVLDLALKEVNEIYQPIEHFVDRIIAEAVYEIYTEGQSIPELETNELKNTENLQSIINWHEQLKPAKQQHEQINTNPFDYENKNLTESFLTSEPTHDADSFDYFPKTNEDSDLFSSTSNSVTKFPKLDDEATTLSEYVPPSLLTNPSNAPTGVNNLMKYTLTAPVYDDSGDDTSMLEDYLPPQRDESLATRKVETDETRDVAFTQENDTEIDEQDNIFSSNSRLPQFEIFASDQPLDISDIESKFTNVTEQIEDTSKIRESKNDNSLWMSNDMPLETVRSSYKGDDEPWELDESGEEKQVTTNPFTDAFNDNAFSLTKVSESHRNFFTDSFNPSITNEKHSIDEDDNDHSSNIETNNSQNTDRISVTYELKTDKIDTEMKQNDEPNQINSHVAVIEPENKILNAECDHLPSSLPFANEKSSTTLNYS